MISYSIQIIFFLLAIEVAVLSISRHERFKRYFDFLPSVFWIYFLPMLASTLGIIDAKSLVYDVITKNLLPASLFLLLIPVDLKAIARLGAPALIMFFAGSAGIILGAPVVFGLFKGITGAETWSGFAALSASWTGGSANMIAVKEAIGTPDKVFLPMVIVDTVVPYVWMGILVALVSLQPIYDRWNRSDRKILDELSRKASTMTLTEHQFHPVATIVILFVAVLTSFIVSIAAKFFPVIKDVISPYAWTIIIISFFGILLSLTPARRFNDFGLTRIGYFLLYFVLTAIGAKASIANIGSAMILIAAGFVLVLLHAVVLISTARLIRAPMFLIAVASQANIGGVASAPIVAEIYQPGLASVGLLLAILGNIIGTYCGIMAGQLCRILTGL